MNRASSANLLSAAILAGAATGIVSWTRVLSSQEYLAQGLRRASVLELADAFHRPLGLAIVVTGVPLLLAAAARRLPSSGRPASFAGYLRIVLPPFVFLFLGEWALGLSSLWRARSPEGAAARLALVAATLVFGWLAARESPPDARRSLAGRLLRASAIATLGLVASLHLGIAFDRWWVVPRGPNVVLVYFDTLRADHIGVYGYSRATTPNLDRLAREGVVFRNVTSQAPATYPSVPSALASKYASEFFDSKQAVIADRHLVLAEALRDRGYRTFGISSSPVVSARRSRYSLGGFEQGFEIFDDGAAEGEEMNWQWRSPEAVVNRALAWLERRPSGKFFLFLYVMDPHDAYRPPEPYDRMFDGSYEGKEFIRRGDPNPYHALITRGFDPGLDAADLRHLVALYDGEIAYADAELGRLWRRIEELGLSDETLLVFTSDHGEEFLDHGGLKHSLTVYREMLDVPLVFRYPPGLPAGVTVERRFVQSLDMAPTILEIAGIAPPSAFQGRSLLPLLRDPDAPWRDHALAESPYTDAKALLQGRWKYIHRFGLSLAQPDLAPRLVSGSELYDVEADPQEREDLFEREPEIARKLHVEMLELLPAVERERLETGAKFEFDEDARERLKALGYLR